ncbi:acetylornithine deacetylase [Ameyamaea chiangmaiensis]|uniref:Acetylornithine deacetylase n=1 Tax=Ameyamaea chiangmaiensis TaxID=442969 RepID=A0A850PA18_9PROT|nr:acetylornithine deacetylase [Ameyamaea chiangmaiensis]MBS4074568.1 acetylornithine deacetylase [Ameyamaea chiangmaiensis]NVN39529.1 acetylornithine deacetylase [Ameyamaea chiangmaiensis]
MSADRTIFTTTEMLARLVAFDTTSRLPDLPLIVWVEAYLGAHGLTATRSRGPQDGKVNLHAIIGPQTDGGIGFAGHVDTVPVDGQAWTRDPFTLHADHGRLYARGAADMKGFVASMLAAVPDFIALRAPHPIHLMLTFDEEITCDGARVLAEDLQARDVRPALCVVGEPTMMTPVIAHKGRLAVRVSVVGQPGHSSAPGDGVNALHAMGEALAWISAEARRLAHAGRRVEGFDPPHTTIQAGVAQGGTILNIIPEQASFEMEWRTVPGDDAHAELDRFRRFLGETIEPWMQSRFPQTGFSVEVLTELPPLSLADDAPLAHRVRQVTGANTSGRVSYGTEAGIYQSAGIASIVCGPGDIAQAHRPDEWIAESQLVACDRFLRAMAARPFAA